MPVITDTSMQTHTLKGSHYGYSGTRIEDLGATEYTLVAIAADQSGSVHRFRRDIEVCLAEIVRACRSAPRSDNVMLRAVAFDHALHEVHGFKPIHACDPATYRGALAAGGTTALYDAAHNAVGSVVAYGEALTGRGFEVNGVVFVVTDGCDCASTLDPDAVAAAVSEAVGTETLQSVLTVLVGVNVADPAVGRELMRFSTAAGFDHYLQLDDAEASTLARLASIASRSIGLASTALSSGTPIRSLTF